MYWNTKCRDIKGWPILSEIRPDTVPGEVEGSREGKEGFCNFSWECPPLEGCIYYLLFRRRPQTGEIRLNIDVDVAVPFQHPVWGRISGHFSLSSPDREAYEEQEYGQHCSSSEKRNSLSHQEMLFISFVHLIIPPFTLHLCITGATSPTKHAYPRHPARPVPFILSTVHRAVASLDIISRWWCA